MGGCQHYGPLLGPSIIRHLVFPKGTMNLNNHPSAAVEFQAFSARIRGLARLAFRLQGPTSGLPIPIGQVGQHSVILT